MSDAALGKRAKAAHIWEKEQHEWYVEPRWTSVRLFEVERFDGPVCDPCCGGGNILASAALSGHEAYGYDVVDRGSAHFRARRDFLSDGVMAANIVTNPPFDQIDQFAAQALRMAERKVAMICPTRRLNAAGKWLAATPLYRVWMLTPRPSMPPGAEFHRLAALGKEPSGGTMDFCWLVWLRGFEGAPTINWLHRDEGPIA